MIKNEIDHRRPILYCGVALTLGYGHAFVCDGYDTNGYFHFNWGWSGDADGFYSLSSLAPTSYSFNANQSAVIGIEPDSLYGITATCTVSVFSFDTALGTVSGRHSHLSRHRHPACYPCLWQTISALEQRLLRQPLSPSRPQRQSHSLLHWRLCREQRHHFLFRHQHRQHRLLRL